MAIIATTTGLCSWSDIGITELSEPYHCESLLPKSDPRPRSRSFFANTWTTPKRSPRAHMNPRRAFCHLSWQRSAAISTNAQASHARACDDVAEQEPPKPMEEVQRYSIAIVRARIKTAGSIPRGSCGECRTAARLCQPPCRCGFHRPRRRCSKHRGAVRSPARSRDRVFGQCSH
jgi:hypothetical protein